MVCIIAVVVQQKSACAAPNCVIAQLFKKLGTMNLLQSFMSCMYPGSIRTESIESIDDYSESRFQVANIDQDGNEVSQGELQLTDKDLIYFRPGKFPTRWPIDYIRRYGCSKEMNIFSFEAGRRCPSGEAIYAFRLGRGAELVDRLRRKIDSQIRIDASTSIDPSNFGDQEGIDPRPLSYAIIDFDTTKALNESAQAHAASRVTRP